MKIKVNYLFWDKECLDSKISKNRNVFKPHNQGQQGGGGLGGGGSGIPVYPKKNSPKYPKMHPNIPKIIPRDTLYLKFKESDIPNTRI